jgi:hypothetical protein
MGIQSTVPIRHRLLDRLEAARSVTGSLFRIVRTEAHRLMHAETFAYMLHHAGFRGVAA